MKPDIAERFRRNHPTTPGTIAQVIEYSSRPEIKPNRNYNILGGKKPSFFGKIKLAREALYFAKTHTMKPFISEFLTSKSGWITRKAIDTLTPILASYAGVLIEKGAPEDLTNGLTTAIIAGVTWIIGLGLSKLADSANKAIEPK
jgi:hypothetical protein